MAKKTAKIRLGGDEYTIHPFTIRELERVTDLVQEVEGGGRRSRLAFGVIRIALERAEPAVENPDDVEATMEEITKAGEVILELAGVMVKRDPPRAQESGEA